MCPKREISFVSSFPKYLVFLGGYFFFEENQNLIYSSQHEDSQLERERYAICGSPGL